MPYCPHCGFEYRAGLTSCPECGGKLLAEPPGEPRYSEEPMVVVYEAPTELLSRRVRAVLEEAGVPVVEQVDRTYWYDGLDFSLTGRYSRLLALESRAEEAKRIVADFLAALERGEFALAEDEDQPATPGPQPSKEG